MKQLRLIFTVLLAAFILTACSNKEKELDGIIKKIEKDQKLTSDEIGTLLDYVNDNADGYSAAINKFWNRLETAVNSGDMNKITSLEKDGAAFDKKWGNFSMAVTWLSFYEDELPSALKSKWESYADKHQADLDVLAKLYGLGQYNDVGAQTSDLSSFDMGEIEAADNDDEFDDFSDLGDDAAAAVTVADDDQAAVAQ